MSELSGAVILVVGATGGLGSRIAEQLAAAGATVVSSGRISADPDAVPSAPGRIAEGRAHS